MPPESWLVVTVAAAFFLLGIAVSPLAWMTLSHRQSRSEHLSEQRFRDLAGQMQTLRDRLKQCEAACQGPQGEPREPVEALRRRQSRPSAPVRGLRPGRLGTRPR